MQNLNISDEENIYTPAEFSIFVYKVKKTNSDYETTKVPPEVREQLIQKYMARAELGEPIFEDN